MKQEHLSKVGGKDYVNYDGLIALAYERGLLSADCEILQYPSDENRWTAIVKATVVVKSADQSGDKAGDYVTASDIGDANADNVGSQIKPHYIRMATTRAFSRAYGTALGVGGLSREELLAADEPEQPSGPAFQAAPANLIATIKRGYDALNIAHPTDLDDLDIEAAKDRLATLTARYKEAHPVPAPDVEAQAEAVAAHAEAAAKPTKPAKKAPVSTTI